MNESHGLGILARVIFVILILSCVAMSVFLLFEYERCLSNPDACNSVVISQDVDDGSRPSIRVSLNGNIVKSKIIRLLKPELND
ncbi:hypothetical protein CSB45_13905 [candidate division KSB3 bacterium]|uniref:Uncharacterized protein n=1 Tax=candidate division KSB3 bacterium TaxID=2044937 RepID=A0A2G6E1E8_9BACT|nr:MAG: hypothetical protein CSB45_13905 [candidate division KSB3 bacterium]PIE28498.1 MAG: hypothetical protein CSA57_13410 [candidate division KSB3 bacterium]